MRPDSHRTLAAIRRWGNRGGTGHRPGARSGRPGQGRGCQRLGGPGDLRPAALRGQQVINDRSPPCSAACKQPARTTASHRGVDHYVTESRDTGLPRAGCGCLAKRCGQRKAPPETRWAWFTMRVRSSSSVRQVHTHRSMIAFIRGMRIPVLVIVIPLSARTASKAAVYLLSRSRITYFTVVPVSGAGRLLKSRT